MMRLVLPSPPIKTYNIACTCGGTLVLDTDGDGRAIERCGTCRRVTATPRARPSDHPLLAAHEAEVAAAMSAIERSRASMPLCKDCNERRAGHRNASRCWLCAERYRLEYDRVRSAARARKAAGQ
jgi:hypothetical protein